MWATKHPIEVVVAAFTLATLAYFHALADVSRQLDSTSLFLEFSNGQWSPTAAAKVHDWSWDVFQLLTDSSNNSWHPPSGALAHVAPGSLTLALPKDSANIPIPSLPLPQALFNHVSALASNAPPLTLITILLGYISMHLTFLSLPFRARDLFKQTPLTYRPYLWITVAILSSSTLAFLVSLPTSSYFFPSISLATLYSSLPFFVITVSFSKPLSFARAVFNHPSVLSQDIRVSTVVDGAWKQVRSQIRRDTATEIAVLIVASLFSPLKQSHAGGLKEFCQLAALILTLDYVFMSTYLAAVFGVVIEVQRIRARTSPSIPGKSFSQSSASSHSPNPIPRLRLLLLTAFLTLHVGNYLNTFHHAHSHSSSDIGTLISAGSEWKGEWESNSGLHGVLHQVVHAEKDMEDVLVRVLGVYYPGEGEAFSSTDLSKTQTGSSFAFRPFSLSKTLSDPVMSKWIVLLLAISCALNGVLLKGVASSVNPISSKIDMERESKPSKEKEERKPAGILKSDINPVEPSPAPIPIPALGPLDPSSKPLVPEPGVPGTPGTPSSRPRRNVSFVDSLVEEMERVQRYAVINRENAGPKVFEFAASSLPPAPSVIPIGDSLDDLGKQREINSDVNIVKPVPIHPKRIDTDMDFSSTSSLSSCDAEGRQDVDTPSTSSPGSHAEPRSLMELKSILTNTPPALKGIATRGMTNEELVTLVTAGVIPAYAIEKNMPEELGRAVEIRRAVLGGVISRGQDGLTDPLEGVPFTNYDYSKVLGACCENVVGYIPIPLGIAGPLTIDGKAVHIPMATAEGTLVASTSRGCKALNAGGGVTTVLTQDAMTRGPALEFPSITSAAKAKRWLDSAEGGTVIKAAFDGTSRFARLQKLKCVMAGRTLYVRFATSTGDAMGMNMISKGVEKALEVMTTFFPDMVVLALSGNYCTDKKPAAVNWIEGRGKSVVAEAVVPGLIVKTVLKTTTADLVRLNTKKNLIGSAMAGSIGGFNAHAANILTAIFLATGQDPAQNVESSNCITLMEHCGENGEDLLITVSMPSIEVGTVGGGTVLTPQNSVLKFLGIQGPHPTSAGHNARQLARIIAAAVVAGELSLMSALAAGHLIKAHIGLNRTPSATPMSTRPNTPAPLTIGGNGSGVYPNGPATGKTSPTSKTSPLRKALALEEKGQGYVVDRDP